jgi:hypothetical protein
MQGVGGFGSEPITVKAIELTKLGRSGAGVYE